MQPDIWEEWWRPACVLDMQPAMRSTRCRRACVRNHVEHEVPPHMRPEPYEATHGRKREKENGRFKSMVDSEDRYSTEKASSVQSTILCDCDAEALFNLIRPSQSYSITIKWRCRPELVQIHGFISVEVLLDTPPGSPKNCPEAKGGSVRVQISPSRPVSVFMMKPMLCPSRDQSSPVKTFILGFGQVLSDQRAASRLEHCELACVNSTWNLG
ncbi:hypothetical protein YC2023_057881 [Brassica napus]